MYDCQRVYVFFNHTTSTYEVYPEFVFSPMFPWWEHAGLFSIRTARFYYTRVSAAAYQLRTK
jgi:hypothetical protein